MAHEISVSGGVEEAFFAMRPAWHRLGTVLPGAVDSSLAMQAAHLDWDVATVPLQTIEGIEVPSHFATVRRDTGKVLGVVSDRYKIVQNREAFSFLDSLQQDGVIKYESAGALKGGRIVWLLARMPSIDEIAPGDKTCRYVLFSTSHDGTRAIHAIPTSVRVVCANTLRIATASNTGFSHTGDVKGKMEQARRYLSQFDEKFTLFRDSARLLATRQLSLDAAEQYLEQLFPIVQEDGRAKTIRAKKVATVRDNMRNERQTIPAIRGTWWALYNAVSESIDHAERKGGTVVAAERHMLSTLTGDGAAFKEQAFSLAVSMSA